MNGLAKIIGISSSGATVTVGGYAAVEMDQLPIQHTANFVEQFGANGEPTTLHWMNEHLIINVTFRPTAATIAAVGDKAILLPKGSVASLSGFKPVKYNGVDILNADWILTGDATLTLNSNNSCDIQLELRNYLANQTSLKTAVPAS
jgi:hypothetical protein